MKEELIKLVGRWGFRLGIVLVLGGLITVGEIKGQSPAPNQYPIKPIDLKSAPATVYTQLEGHPLVTWNTLAHFRYDAPNIEEEIDPNLRLKKKRYPVPGFVKALDKASVATYGFMIPIDTDESGNKVLSFILARSQATCCYGITPQMNEWMFVTMAPGKPAELMMDVPVTVFGGLSVGEEKKKDMGWSLYRMVSAKVIVPKGLW